MEEGAPVAFYHCVSRVVDRNFVLESPGTDTGPKAMYHNVGHVPEALGEGASRLSSALPVYLQPWHRRNLGVRWGSWRPRG